MLSLAKLCRQAALILGLAGHTSPLLAEELRCVNAPVTVIAASDALAQRICRIAERAVAEQAACNVPLTQHIEIATRETLAAN